MNRLNTLGDMSEQVVFSRLYHCVYALHDHFMRTGEGALMLGADKVQQVDRKHVFWSRWCCVISCGDAALGTIHRAAGQVDVRAPFTPAKRDSALAEALGATSVEPPREEVPAQFRNAMKGAIPDSITIARGKPPLEPGRSRSMARLNVTSGHQVLRRRDHMVASQKGHQQTI